MTRSKSYRMPAEWEPHEGTWLAWPHNREHWPGKFEPIPTVYAEIIRALAPHEKVFLCVKDAEMEENARTVLAQLDLHPAHLRNVLFFQIPTDASWSRDHGPIFVQDADGKLAITDWIFNSWGGKYPPWDQDDVVPQKIGEQLQLPVIQTGMVLEGGSIDVNGRGTLLTTEQCLLNPNRNPHLSRREIEEMLHGHLGTNHVLWLKEGIVGDDTDGHIDDIARFVNETTVVCVLEENREDENYPILRTNFDELTQMTDQDGKPLNVIPLPMPDPIEYEGLRLPASYANFYIANGTVLVPLFGVSQDETTLHILKYTFPEREVVGINCVDLV